MGDLRLSFFGLVVASRDREARNRHALPAGDRCVVERQIAAASGRRHRALRMAGSPAGIV